MRTASILRQSIAAMCVATLVAPCVLAEGAAGSTIRGRVINPADNTPLGGISVMATPDGDLIPLERVSTSSDGTFELPGIPPGTYGLSFEQGTAEWTSAMNVPVASGQTVAVVVRLAPASTDTASAEGKKGDKKDKDEPESPVQVGKKPTRWMNPLIATLAVIGAGVAIGAALDQEESTASPSTP